MDVEYQVLMIPKIRQNYSESLCAVCGFPNDQAEKTSILKSFINVQISK